MNRPQASNPSVPAEIGLGIRGDLPLSSYAHVGRLAEDHGIDVLSVFADLWFQPALPPLMELARATSRVRLGAACWNPYTTHPYELAGQAAALQELSGDRAYVGLARGSWLGDLGVDQDRPLTRLREAVEVIRLLLTGDGAGFEGNVYRLEKGRRLRYELSGRMPPVLLGTWGRRTAHLAGQIANEVKMGGSANPDVVKVMQRWLDAGSQRAGRAAGSVGVVLGAVTVVAHDGRDARRRAREEVALYLPVVASLDPTVDVPDDLLERLRAAVAAGQHEAAGRLVPDDLLDRFAFAGNPDDVAAQAQSLIDAGVRRVEFGTPHGLTWAEGIDLIGTEVIPQLRR